MACRAWASMAGLTIVCEMLGVPHEHNRILTPELHLNARGTCGAAQSKYEKHADQHGRKDSRQPGEFVPSAMHDVVIRSFVVSTESDFYRE